MGGELEAGYAFEKVARDDLAGKFHQPEDLQEPAPLQGRQFVRDELPEKNAVTVE